MKYALIENGSVVNVVLWDGVAPFEGSENLVPAGDTVAIGDSYGQNGFSKPPVETAPAPVPQSVSMRQARLALIDAGHYDAVQAAIAQADERTRVEWEFAATVERGSPIVATLAQALGLLDETLDALFTAAATL